MPPMPVGITTLAPKPIEQATEFVLMTTLTQVLFRYERGLILRFGTALLP